MNDSSPTGKSIPPGTPAITSFVIRFVHPQNRAQALEPESREFAPAPEAATAQYVQAESFRGTIRHVQSDREIVFTDWHEAVTFIQTYVPIIDARKNDP